MSAFQSWFWPKSAPLKMKEKLCRLEHGNLSVSVYEAHIAAILRHVPDMANTENDKIFLFRKGSRQSIKVLLATLSYPSYQSIVKAARTIEREQLLFRDLKTRGKRRMDEAPYHCPGKKQAAEF